MELELNQLNSTEFENVEVGDTFYYGEIPYLRIADFTYHEKKEEQLVNAMCLTDFTLEKIDDDVLVRVFNSKLVELS